MVDVASVIGSLPRNEKELVTLLCQEGIKGSRYDAHNCPLALYIAWKSKTPVQVTGRIISWIIPTTGPMGNLLTISVDSSDAVRNFISNFDQGLYPNLIS